MALRCRRGSPLEKGKSIYTRSSRTQCQAVGLSLCRLAPTLGGNEMYVPDLEAFSFQSSSGSWVYMPGSNLYELSISGDEKEASREAYSILKASSDSLDELVEIGRKYIGSICTLQAANELTKCWFAGATVARRRNVLSLYVHLAYDSEERGLWSVEFLPGEGGCGISSHLHTQLHST